MADYFNQLDEDNKRLVIRGDIKQWNQMLLEAAHNAGVITNQEYAEFHNAGYIGLYGGLTVQDIHKKLHLPDALSYCFYSAKAHFLFCRHLKHKLKFVMALIPHNRL